MVTHPLSPLRALTLSFAGALAALLTAGCVVPTEVGSQDSPLSTAGDPHGMAFHQAPDPDTLHVLISTFPLSCSNPGMGASSSDGACQVGWTVAFALPAAFQAPGVYSLTDPALQSFNTELLGSDEKEQCVGGGGGSIRGTIVEVLRLDSGSITVRLGGFGDIPADGDYDVPLCK